jgi:hypothetical protein
MVPRFANGYKARRSADEPPHAPRVEKPKVKGHDTVPKRTLREESFGL